MKKKRTTGIKRIVMSHVFSDDEPYIDRTIVPQLIEAIEKHHSSALKRAVREGYDAGWKDGASENLCNDEWNRLAKKYGMRGVT